MQKENPGSWQNISARLDGLESIPGEIPLDGEFAWTGVRTKLYPAKKKAAVWWWAAAAFLLFTGTTLRFRYSSYPATDNPPGNNKGAAAKTSPPPLRVSVTDSSLAARAKHQSTALSAGPAATRPRRATPYHLPVTADIPASKAGTQYPAPGVATVVTGPYDSLAASRSAKDPQIALSSFPAKRDSVFVVAASRKPLRVVHLNDLEDPGFAENGSGNAVKSIPGSTVSRFPIGVFNGPSSTSANAGLATPRNSFFRINLER